MNIKLLILFIGLFAAYLVACSDEDVDVPPVPIHKIVMNDSLINITMKDTFLLAVKIYPKDATDSIRWECIDNSMLKIDTLPGYTAKMKAGKMQDTVVLRPLKEGEKIQILVYGKEKGGKNLNVYDQCYITIRE